MTSAKEIYQLSRAILGDANGQVIVLKAYMDESGIHDGSPVVTVAAYVALPRVWRDWTKSWNRRKRPLAAFHANECAALQGEFKGWSAERRDAFVAQLLPTIPEHGIAGFVVGIRMDDFREVCETHPYLADVIKTPYATCFQWVVQDILRFLNKHGDEQRLAFFHEVNASQNAAHECFAFIERFDGYRRRMSLTFGSKQDYVPLQAADVLAYEGNKRFRNPKGQKRRAWTAINPSGARRNARYFDKASLLTFVNDLASWDRLSVVRS